MLILGIETSCDETAVAVVENGQRVLSNVISSSQKLFASLAGVIPEEAARRQVECMIPVLQAALATANVRVHDISFIAVTQGPGLLGSLLVGTTTARTLAHLWGIPLLPVHHTLGHLTSPWLSMPENPVCTPQFPILSLSASGGHTDVWLRTDHLRGALLGRTRDDAAGEAFDKGASLLDLPYPGGPSIAREAEGGDETRYTFPEPLKAEQTLDFSYSGLKTALRYLLRDDPSARASRKDVAASYQFALCKHLVRRIQQILRLHPEIREVHLVGGVSANTRLRAMTQELCNQCGIILRAPTPLSFCTDNAAMIAAAGYFLHRSHTGPFSRTFVTSASLPIEETLIQHC